MCGLFGWKFGECIPVEKRVIVATVLSIENEIRGKDSWGVLNLQTREIMKELGKVTKGVYKFCMLPEVLCHTRFATVGAVTVENAHPFVYKHIIGAHNGTVANHWQVNNAMNRDFDVDSIHLFAHIADNEQKKELRAHGAITYVDTREEEGGLFLSKFNGGGLNVYSVNAPDGEPGMIVWSSTQHAIETALAVAGLEGYAWEVGEGKVYEIKEYTLYNTVKELGFERPIKVHVPTIYQGYEGHGVYTHDHSISKWEKKDLKPYYDHGEIIWNKCCMCGRWLRVVRIGTDDVCSMCEEVYRENMGRKIVGEDGVHTQLTVVEIDEETTNPALAGLCDYCGTVEAEFHIPAMQGIVCADCMAMIDVELSSGIEVRLIAKEKRDVIEPLALAAVVSTEKDLEGLAEEEEWGRTWGCGDA